MRQLILGILAHVDAGKTTLTESMLYQNGNLRKPGRVDKGDAFLDTDVLEKERGITIFSKQAIFQMGDLEVTLVDTPGHVDFSAEMERILQILDAALLVVNGADGLQSHTRTLWRLLQQYDIPVIIFVNKMDRPIMGKEELLKELQDNLCEGCMDFGGEKPGTEEFYDSIAMCDETAMELFLDTGSIPDDVLSKLISQKKVIPCYFGSALRQEGIEDLLQGIKHYVNSNKKTYQNGDRSAFGGRVYKIARDDRGNRLTYMKVTGGTLNVKDVIRTFSEGVAEEEKINQIRRYNGVKYETVQQAEAGMVCAVTGLEHTFAGQGLGEEEGIWLPVLEPVLSYGMILPQGTDVSAVLPKIRELAEEEPDLHLVWDEDGKEIRIKLMGEVQIQVLQRRIKNRFGLDVSFGEGKIVYKETIGDRVEGVGHFEPLRHYAEVHLLMEPGEPGSGLVFASSCSEDVLDRNWQRLILTHLREREHRGVLTGAAITDMKITLASGRAHLKHTEGGDFRQAVYRGVRQGLMQAQSILLEPYYDFCLEVPEHMTGRAMTDLERLYAVNFQPEIEKGMAVLRGSGPVSCLQGYQKEVVSYTKGLGRLNLVLKGYGSCHNTQEVVARCGYEAERDVKNTPDSVFCAHGAGFIVPWYEVKDYMHLPSVLTEKKEMTEESLMALAREKSRGSVSRHIGTEEIDAILKQTFYANQRETIAAHKGISAARRRAARDTGERPSSQARTYVYRGTEKKPEYLLVDGYNIIFAWEDLKELAEENLDSARGKLLDVLSNYQGIRGCELIAVFDAYRLEGHPEETVDYHNIHVVYTRQAETADRFIERFAHENSRRYDVTVATSDGMEQIIIRGEGCGLITARELKEEVRRAGDRIVSEYAKKQESGKVRLGDFME